MKHRNGRWLIGTAAFVLGAGAAHAQLENDIPGSVDVAPTPGVPARSDAQLGLEVQAELSQQLQIPGLTSQTTNGVTRLQGTVRTQAEKDRAEQIAQRVNSIGRVDNFIVVDPAAANAAATNYTEGAFTLEAAVRGNLAREPSLVGRNIQVQTRSNIITLTGEVSSQADKDLAGRIAADTRDVTEVRNRIVVRGE
jgi:osmotically-inducible protein OsmY